MTKTLSCALALLTATVTTTFAQAAPQGIKLSANWKVAVPTDALAKELEEILSIVCEAHEDLAPQPDKKIFRNITYLMPAGEAIKLLGGVAGMKRQISTSAFPRFSFSYQEVRTKAHNFDRVFLITDLANQVVAVELVDENPAGGEVRNAQEHFNWRTVDFVQGDTTASTDSFVRRRINVLEVGTSGPLLEERPKGMEEERPKGMEEKRPKGMEKERPKRSEWLSNPLDGLASEKDNGWVIQIDSQQISSRTESYRGRKSSYDYKVQKHTCLILPRPLGNLLLLRVQSQLR